MISREVINIPSALVATGVGGLLRLFFQACEGSLRISSPKVGYQIETVENYEKELCEGDGTLPQHWAKIGGKDGGIAPASCSSRSWHPQSRRPPSESVFSYLGQAEKWCLAEGTLVPSSGEPLVLSSVPLPQTHTYTSI